jgi:hypothetical protein
LLRALAAVALQGGGDAAGDAIDGGGKRHGGQAGGELTHPF